MRTVKRCLLALLAAVLLCAAGAAVVFWHQGYRVYAVRTGSMTPTYLPGDFVIDAPPGGSYPVGTVVTFRSHGGVSPVTTHRVHGKTAEGLETKGDANRTPDVAPVAPENVVGRVIAGVPNGGYVLVFLQQPAGVGSVMAVLLSLVFSWRVFFPPAEEPRHVPRHSARAVRAAG